MIVTVTLTVEIDNATGLIALARGKAIVEHGMSVESSRQVIGTAADAAVWLLDNSTELGDCAQISESVVFVDEEFPEWKETP